MQNKTVFTATEARQNFFQFIKLAESGRNVFIKKRGELLKIKVEKTSQKKEITKKLKALEELSKIGLPTMPIKKMKKIYASVHDIKL